MGGLERRLVDLAAYVAFMRANGVSDLTVGDVRVTLRDVAIRDVGGMAVLNQDLTEPGGASHEETTEERMVREQREHTERESLLLYSTD